jgi:hypothetical protein
MHESDVAFNQEMEYLKHEKEMAAQESSMENYYAQTRAEIDAIDFYYGGEGSWGLPAGEEFYDYGYEENGLGELS